MFPIVPFVCKNLSIYTCSKINTLAKYVSDVKSNTPLINPTIDDYQLTSKQSFTLNVSKMEVISFDELFFAHISWRVKIIQTYLSAW